MVTFGYFLSSEEHSAPELVRGAVLAEQAGFEAAWISDHFHPWLNSQGESPFVWSVLGAIAAKTNLPVTTAVTCPTIRIHPAIIAQAAATTQQLFEGRFTLGIGTGEALNECIFGDTWPTPETRLQMIEEAVTVIRRLWGGDIVDHHGRHYTVENARIYTRPDNPPEILMSGFGPKAIELAARIADGFITTQPSAEDIATYRRGGGTGRLQAGLKVCWAEDKTQAVKTAHHYWRNSGLPGQISQDGRTVTHFEELSQLVTEESTAESVPCGPDPQPHIEAVKEYVDAGFDEIYIAQMGPDQEGMIRFYEREVLPALRG